MTLNDIMKNQNCEKKQLLENNPDYKIYVIYSDLIRETGSYGKPKFVIDYGNEAKMCISNRITEYMKKYGKKIVYLNKN